MANSPKPPNPGTVAAKNRRSFQTLHKLPLKFKAAYGRCKGLKMETNKFKPKGKFQVSHGTIFSQMPGKSNKIRDMRVDARLEVDALINEISFSMSTTGLNREQRLEVLNFVCDALNEKYGGVE